jgi:predicted nucleotidyltransferase
MREIRGGMPKVGIIMPKMGTRVGIGRKQKRAAPRNGGLASALFTGTQQRVLGLLFGQPERSFYLAEIIARSRAGSGAVQRELARLAESGLVTVHLVGNQKHFQANPDSPIYEELCGVARKTVGLAEPLRAALSPFIDRIAAAFVFGSIAKRHDTASSDIDLMIISDALSYADLFGALQAVEEQLGRTIKPTILSRKDLGRRVKNDNAFVTRVLSQPKLWLLGEEHALVAV